MTDVTTAKQAAGRAAATWVEDGMALGLGTGSTTAYALEAIGQRIEDQGLDVRGVPTSFAAERLGRRYGIPLTTLDEVERLDIAFDGADEVDEALNCIKGRGAAHTREKVVAAQAERFVVLVDPSKQVDQLGSTKPVPVEVVPMAATPVRRKIEALDARAELRMGEQKDGPVVTDQGLWVIDAHFERIAAPENLDRTLKQIPGVLDHGLFIDRATDVIVGHPDGTTGHLR